MLHDALHLIQAAYRQPVAALAMSQQSVDQIRGEAGFPASFGSPDVRQRDEIAGVPVYVDDSLIFGEIKPLY